MRKLLPKPKLPSFKLPSFKLPSFRIVDFFKALKDLTLLPFRSRVMRKLVSITLWTPKKIGWVLRKIMYGIVATPGTIARSLSNYTTRLKSGVIGYWRR